MHDSFTLPPKVGREDEKPENARDVSVRSKCAVSPKQFSEVHVLLVEDNIPALTILTIMVKQLGAKVSQAEDAETALQLIELNSFHLIITDLGLPGKSGDELTAAVRLYEKKNQMPAIKIVGLTGHALSEIRQRCIEAGMNELYRKPISTQALKALIETVVST